MLIILVSIILVITDLGVDNSDFTSISKIFRAVFRFLRIFLLFRKVFF